MSAISLKSITGITSITTPAGVDNVFTVHTNDTTERFRVDQTGNLNIAGIVTVTKDIDVDGHTNLDNVSIAGVTTMSGDLTVTSGDVIIQGVEAKLHLTDTNNDDDYLVFNNNGTFKIYDATNNADRLQINSNGDVTIGGDTNFGAGIDVDGHTNLDNVSVSGVSTFSGVVRVPNGSAGAPAIHFGDSDSGVYGDASNGVRLTAGGSDTIVATTNGVTFPPSVAALTSLTIGSQSAHTKPLYFADANGVQSASIILDNSSQELRIKNSRFSGQITFTTYNVERLRITSTGVIQFNGTNSSDNTNKLVYLTTPSYDTDEEPFGFIHSGTYSNQNLLYLGGGMTSSYNACTLMKFWTADINTQVGTERLCIESWGGIQNNQGAIYGGGVANEPKVHFNGAAPSADAARGQFAVSDSAAYNASPIARISLVTRYNSAGGYTYMGGIEGGKENTTDGQYGGFVRIMTRPHGSGNQERLRIFSNGDISCGGAADNNIYNDTSGGGINFKNGGQLVIAKQASSGADPLVWLNDTGQTTNKFLLFAQDGTEKASIGLAGNDLRFARDGYNETLRITSNGHLRTQGNNNGNAVGMELRNNNTAAYSHAELSLTSQNATTSKIWCDVPNAGMRLQYNGGSTVKVNQSGNLVMANGSGIDFSATANSSGSMGSELLDDYEEGSWTPYIRTTNNTTQPSYTQQLGLYTKVGRLVTWMVRIRTSGELSTGSGATEMWGFPYAAMTWGGNGDWPGGGEIAYYYNLRGAYGTNPRILGPYNNATFLRFHTFSNQTDISTNGYNVFFTNNTLVIMTGQYYTA